MARDHSSHSPPPVDAVEPTILLEATRYALGGARRASSRVTDQRPSAPFEVNWERFLEMAGRHRLAAFIGRETGWMKHIAVPTPVSEWLGKRAEFVAKRNLLLHGELLRVVDILELDGIPAIPFKGPEFANRFHPKPLYRTCWDLDLLLQRDQVLQAKEALCSEGFRPEDHWSSRRERRELIRNCEYNLDHPETGTHVELHWRFVPSYISFGLAEPQLRGRYESVQFLGRLQSVIPAEEMLVIMCVHNGGKHRWDRLRTVCDLDCIVASVPELKWEYVVELARVYHVERIVRSGLALSQQLLGTTLPPFIEDWIALDHAAAMLTRSFVASFFGPPTDIGNRLENVSQYLSSRERPRDRWRYHSYVLSSIIRPTDKEEALVRLPRGLRVLYLFIRPVRLAWKYLHTLRRAQQNRNTYRRKQW
jgi:hypothetical protein